MACDPRQARRWGWFNTDRKSTRLNSSHRCISYAVFCLKKKKIEHQLWTQCGQMQHANAASRRADEAHHEINRVIGCHFFLNDPAPPEIYPLPLYAALPI